MNAVGEYWQALGRRIEEGLRGRQSLDAAFPEVATGVLQSVSAPRVTATAIADWMIEEGRLPEQVNFHSGFGEPPLVVYQTDQFYLEVLFWFPGGTAIHGHGFNGAFVVLDGMSIQAEFEFHERSQPEEGVRLGRLEPRGVEFIEMGKVCTIIEGEGFVHSVTHLGTPSLTLVARTYSTGKRQQFRYHRCGFAVLSTIGQVITRQAEVLAAVHDGAPDAFPARLSGLLERAGGYRFYSVLSVLLKTLRVRVFAEDVLPLVEARHGATQPDAVAAIREITRKFNLWQKVRMLPQLAQQVQCALADVFPDAAEREAILCRSYRVAGMEELPQPWQDLAKGRTPAERQPA